MAELVMDNPFSQSGSTTSKYAKPVQDLKDCVGKLKEEFVDTHIPLNDDNQDLHRFCAKLEYLLQAGLKIKTGLLGGKKDYWNYFCDCLGNNRSLNDGIQCVKSMSEVRSSLGRGRALIRFGLTHQRLADTLQQCILNSKVTGEWYHPQSVWLNPAISSDLVGSLYDLNDLQFDLSSREYDLDTSWPSFAKRAYGMGQNLQIPSRSTSIGSLSSMPSSLPAASVDPDTQSQVDQLEHEKLAAEHKSYTLESQLAQLQGQKIEVEAVNKRLKSKVTEVELNSKDIQMRSDSNDVLCEKLANELHLKESLWAEKEQHYRECLEESKKTIKKLEEGLEKASLEAQNKPSTSSPLDMVEVKGKLRLSETNNKTLRIELDSAQKELIARNKVHEVKDALVNMQEKKLDQYKKQLELLQTLVQKYQSVSPGESPAEVEKLKQELKDREKICDLMTRKNKDLEEILDTVKTKSDKIGKLAKEKLTKYKADNKELTAKVEELEAALKSEGVKSVEAEQIKNGDQQQIIELTKDKEELEKTISELKTNFQVKEALADEGQRVIRDNKEEIRNLTELVESLKSESGSKETELSENLMKSQADNRALTQRCSDLGNKIAEFENGTEANRVEQERLKSEVEGKTNELVMVNRSLNEKIQILESSESGKEAEKQVLVHQLESQAKEMEGLREELTDLGKLLAQASSLDEVDAENDLNKMLLSVINQNKLLHETVESVEVKNDELHATVQTTELKLGETNKELEKLKSEREELQLQLCRNEASLNDWQLQLQQKNVFVEELLQKHSKLEEQIKLLETRMEHGEMKVREMAEESDMKVKLVAAKQVEFEALRDKVSLLEQLVEQTENEKNEMETQHERLSEELKNADRKCKELENVIEVEKNTRTSLEKERNEAKTVSEQQKVELERKVESVRAKEEELLQTSEIKSSFEEKLQDANRLNSLFKEKLDSLKKELVDVKSDAKESSETYQQKIAELEQGQGELMKQNCETVEKQERKNKEYMEEIQGLKEVKVKLSGKIDKLEGECDKLMQSVQNYQSENDTLSNSVKSLEGDVAKLQYAKESLQSEVEDLAKQLQETSHLNEELLTSVEQRSSDLSEKEAQQIEIQQQFEAKTEELKALQNQLSERTSEVESLNVKVKEMDQEKSALSESMNASYFELKEKLGQYECENETLREEMQSIIGDKEKQFLTLAQENSNLKSESDSAAEELAKKQEDCLHLDSKLTELSQELEAFQTTLQEKDEFISQSKRESQKRVEEMDQLRVVLDSKEDETGKKLQEINNQVGKLQDLLKEKEEELLSQQGTHQQELQAVKFQLSTELMQIQSTVDEQKDKEKDVTNMTEKINEMESLVEDLQSQLEDKKAEVVTLKEKHHEQVDDLEEKLFEKERESQLMAEQLVRSNQVIEQDLQKVQSERKDSCEQLKALRMKNVDLEAENVEIKKKIIQLIKEKDTLWKKSDKLEYQKKMKASLVWENSDMVNNCTGCNTQFGFTLRKHHCRLCGQIFCHYCCNNWVLTSFSSKKERVCGMCLQQQSQLESASEGEDSGSEGQTLEEGEEQQSVQLPSLRSPMWKVKPGEQQEALNLEIDDTVLNPKRSLTGEFEAEEDSAALGTPGSPCVSLDQEKLLSMTDESKSDRLQQQQQQTVETGARTDEEVYDLITSEEVEASLQEPVPDPDTEMASMLTSESFDEDGSVEGPAELWIRPGKAYATAVRIDQAGTTLKWEFTTYPKDINFGLVYRETEWTLFEDSDSLIPMCKCNSHKKPIDGELTARKPGIYTLIFDNKSSRLTGRQF